MLGLRRLKVAGFRAFKEERRFDFDRPAILLFGENHAGKSSTLNAIEWCLFGTKECVGRGTVRLNSNSKSGIRAADS